MNRNYILYCKGVSRALYASVFCLSILVAISCFPVLAVSEELFDDMAYFFDPRYEHVYEKTDFLPGERRVSFNPNLHLKIGIVINNKSKLHLQDIIATITEASPFDRYRDFFVFLPHHEVQRDIHLRNHFITAYNGDGSAIPGGFDVGSSAVRAGLVVLNVDDFEFMRSGTLGYTHKNLAVAQKSTILHELGHALAHLGDEYSINEDANEFYHTKKRVLNTMGVKSLPGEHDVWFTERANLAYRTSKVLKWQPLIDQGILPDVRIKRVQMREGKDIGRFLIPTKTCCMNTIYEDTIAYCPVCQLQIIDAICSLTGATPPWEE